MHRSTCRLATVAALLAAGGLAAAATAPHQAAPPRGSSGFAMPSRVVSLGAPLDGAVAEIAVAEGDEVAAGDLLFRMDDRVAQAAVEAQRVLAGSNGSIRRAEVAVRHAQSVLARLESLADATSPAELDDARFDLLAAEASLEEARDAQRLAQATLERELARLAEHAVAAPFDGIVTRVHVEPGATLERAAAVVELVSVDQLEAIVHLPAFAVQGLKVGGWMRLRAGAPVSVELEALVIGVDRVIDPASQTVRCVLAIDNADGALPGGFTVRVDDAVVAASAAPDGDDGD